MGPHCVLLFLSVLLVSGFARLEASIQKSATVRKPYLSPPPLLELPFAIEESPQKEETENLAPVGVFFTASYTYWCASEENLTLARTGFIQGIGSSLSETESGFIFNNLLSQPFQYQSGFQVGTGWKEGNWTLKGEYTWVSNTTSQTSIAPTNNPVLGQGVWLVSPWFLQLSDVGQSLAGTEVNSKWHLRMDIADLVTCYSLPQSKHFAIIPYGGVRAAWIRQKLNLTLVEAPSEDEPPIVLTIQSVTGSQCWSLGPRFGSEIDVFLAKGFRIEGDLSLSLLYTQYGKIFHREDSSAVSNPYTTLSASLHNQQALRPVLECSLGLGWKREIISRGYTFDLAATYDFMLWWNQNMMRETMGTFWDGNPTNGDLYLHGLTISGSFGF